MDEVRLTSVDPCGMILLRGAHEGALKAVAEEVTGLRFPPRRGIALEGARALAWMSPDELLLLVSEAAPALERIGAALDGVHHLAADVSDLRVQFRLHGTGTREVLAKLAPADLSPEGLPQGEIRRSQLGQVAAAFWQSGEDAFDVICFRSVGAYMQALLTDAIKGGPVGYF